jgi:hypothetical protein
VFAPRLLEGVLRTLGDTARYDDEYRWAGPVRPALLHRQSEGYPVKLRLGRILSQTCEQRASYLICAVCEATASHLPLRFTKTSVQA